MRRSVGSLSAGRVLGGTLAGGLAVALVFGLCAATAVSGDGSGPTAVDFNRDVRPILAENCLTCHGPDDKARKAGLRLDSREHATAALPSGARAVVPGRAAASELIARVTAGDPETRMPPSKAGKRLTADQVATLRRWIDAGADWSTHWAFRKPVRPGVPQFDDPQLARWVRNPIDAFVLERLRKEGLRPAPEADRPTLLRRLSFDLTGLPPTPAEQEAFLQDASPDAYERLVDRLLASPHFGERMAQHWLDLARFGDSDGYHDDTPRVMYQYRDYVIEAFNRNKPFDQFTLEQLAGDLLPTEEGPWAGLEQKIASAFHRLGPTSSEGGADAQEYLAKYAVDRVNTTAAVWLGVTMHCAECHDHKYDPFTQKEYYQLFAFFNQVPEDALYRGNDAPPVIPTPSKEQQAKLLDLGQKIAHCERELKTLLERPADDDAARAAWEQKLAAGQTEEFTLDPWQVIGPFPAKDGQPPPFDYAYPPEKEFDPTKAYDEGKLRWQPRPEFVDGKVHYLRGENCATYFYRTIKADRRQGLTLYLGSDDGIKVWVNGRLVHSNLLVRGAAPNQDRASVVLEPGENRVLMKIVNLQGGYGFYFSTREKPEDKELAGLVAAARTPAAQRTADQQAALKRHFRERTPAVVEARARLAELNQQKAAVERAVPRLRIMADLPEGRRRPTHVLVRGDYRSPGERVEPGVPAVLPPLVDARIPLSEFKPTRLDLARWLVSPEHPLTARVVVNRFWQMVFGQGLVRTAEDFGTRGELPSHPELLDWLAVEFREGWDVKKVLRLIVTSSTYRQSSRASRELLERDPGNVLLARGPRFRLPAEFIRDNALAVGGLLDRSRVGGPSVKPYQPGDLWRELAYGDSPDKAYRQDHGPDLYRRGVYTFWKRSVHYPAFATFDAPNREVCVCRRAVTNTPLQAFVTLNDVTYVEAARVFAQSLMQDAGSVDERVTLAYRRALGRPPSDRERQVLAGVYQKLLAKYRADRRAAEALAAAGEAPRPAGLDPAEHAAWTGVCQVMLNLDEFLTKE